MSTRFTAVIKIVKVEEKPAVLGRYANQPEISPATRQDTELASIIVRNSDLEGLLIKAKGHLDLVEE
jgi:hypothetical protein